MCVSRTPAASGRRIAPARALAPRFWFALIAPAIAVLSIVAARATEAQVTDAPSKPRRIVSLNLCTDELVLRLADHENIASVTWLSRDPTYSNVARLAARVPINRGLAGEVIPLDPDLVVAGVHTARTAAALLKRAGFPVLEIEVPRSLDDVRAQIRQLAKAVGEPDRGERMIADMDARLAVFAAATPRTPRRALVLDPNGFTTGAGSLVDQIITAAGLTNVAAGLGLGSYARIPLEIAATSGADVFIVNGRRDGPASLATELLQHPILAKLPHRTEPVVLPSRLWTCGGPAVLEAIDVLLRMTGPPQGLRVPE